MCTEGTFEGKYKCEVLFVTYCLIQCTNLTKLNLLLGPLETKLPDTGYATPFIRSFLLQLVKQRPPCYRTARITLLWQQSNVYTSAGTRFHRGLHGCLPAVFTGRRAAKGTTSFCFSGLLLSSEHCSATPSWATTRREVGGETRELSSDFISVEESPVIVRCKMVQLAGFISRRAATTFLAKWDSKHVKVCQAPCPLYGF
jgi:hypothetical protein